MMVEETSSSSELDLLADIIGDVASDRRQRDKSSRRSHQGKVTGVKMTGLVRGVTWDGASSVPANTIIDDSDRSRKSNSHKKRSSASRVSSSSRHKKRSSRKEHGGSKSPTRPKSPGRSKRSGRSSDKSRTRRSAPSRTASPRMREEISAELLSPASNKSSGGGGSKSPSRRDKEKPAEVSSSLRLGGSKGPTRREETSAELVSPSSRSRSDHNKADLRSPSSIRSGGSNNSSPTKRSIPSRSYSHTAVGHSGSNSVRLWSIESIEGSVAFHVQRLI